MILIYLERKNESVKEGGVPRIQGQIIVDEAREREV